MNASHSFRLTCSSEAQSEDDNEVVIAYSLCLQIRKYSMNTSCSFRLTCFASS